MEGRGAETHSSLHCIKKTAKLNMKSSKPLRLHTLLRILSREKGGQEVNLFLLFGNIKDKEILERKAKLVLQECFPSV